jgi:hypothetical protein
LDKGAVVLAILLSISVADDGALAAFWPKMHSSCRCGFRNPQRDGGVARASSTASQSLLA